MKMESDERLGVLFLQMYDGVLIGIDLDEHDNYKKGTSPPPLASSFYLNLSKSGFPIGMRHVQIHHKHYFVGGVCKFEKDIAYLSSSSSFNLIDYDVEDHVGEIFINQIHEFHPKLVDLNPLYGVKRDVVTNLADPKVALVANLEGNVYLLHHWGHPSIPLDPKPRVLFERFVDKDGTWHEAPTPPFCGSLHDKFKSIGRDGDPRQIPHNRLVDYFSQLRNVPRPIISYEKFESLGECPYPYPYHHRRDMLVWPWSMYHNPANFPVYCQFVVDDKWLLFSQQDNSLQIFSHNHGLGEWRTYFRLAEDVRGSFLRCAKYLPSTALCLSDLTLLIAGDDSFAVFLGIFNEDCELDSTIPCELETTRVVIQKLYAFSMSKKSFKVNCFQELDQVFSGMFIGALGSLNLLHIRTVRHQLLDLGAGAAGDGYSRRICAILEGNGSTDNVPYIFISIFDLQVIQEEIKAPDDPTKSCNFLNVSMVKKLVFKLADKKESIFDAFILPPELCY